MNAIKFTLSVVAYVSVFREKCLFVVKSQIGNFGVGEVSSEQYSSEQCTAVLLYCCTAPLLAVASSEQ